MAVFLTAMGFVIHSIVPKNSIDANAQQNREAKIIQSILVLLVQPITVSLLMQMAPCCH